MSSITDEDPAFSVFTSLLSDLFDVDESKKNPVGNVLACWVNFKVFMKSIDVGIGISILIASMSGLLDVDENFEVCPNGFRGEYPKFSTVELSDWSGGEEVFVKSWIYV
ncbi:hypothetical protein K435DRAFT_811985 [Dendrothele bispora CBS 962.96]|uniref:Uncharacterized protein n=1 Tax=Dendrothele bispora (strain CBS 962.96) TaxID=1314807 RepID=A0A4S8KQD9_DENBC|nr:hypothetical protein K435DRAFT_811985 [Dendrothele bispora CBS 962.96]